MNIREVDQDDVDEVRTFRQALLLAERLNYSHDIQQLIEHAVRHIRIRPVYPYSYDT